MNSASPCHPDVPNSVAEASAPGKRVQRAGARRANGGETAPSAEPVEQRATPVSSFCKGDENRVILAHVWEDIA
jgi:hypothetical protein